MVRKQQNANRAPLSEAAGLGGAAVPKRCHQRIRIGFSDLEPLWNPEDDKYKVFCRSVHVSKAALYVSYVQLVVSFMFAIFFAYNFMMVNSTLNSHDSFVEQLNTRYMSQLMMAISLHVLLIVVLVHGVKTERKSLLMPYIVYAAITVLTGLVGVVNDLVYLDTHVGSESSSGLRSQLRRHLFGTLVQAWFLSIVWRCYHYLGDKQVARQIRDQMYSTASAFRYPENLMSGGYSLMSQPPPYADTVMHPTIGVAPPVYIGKPCVGIEKSLAVGAAVPSPTNLAETIEQATEAKEDGKEEK